MSCGGLCAAGAARTPFDADWDHNVEAEPPLPAFWICDTKGGCFDRKKNSLAVLPAAPPEDVPSHSVDEYQTPNPDWREEKIGHNAIQSGLPEPDAVQQLSRNLVSASGSSITKECNSESAAQPFPKPLDKVGRDASYQEENSREAIRKPSKEDSMKKNMTEPILKPESVNEDLPELVGKSSAGNSERAHDGLSSMMTCTGIPETNPEKEDHDEEHGLPTQARSADEDALLSQGCDDPAKQVSKVKLGRRASKEFVFEAYRWEKFLAGDIPSCFGGTAWICTMLMVLITVALGSTGMKFSSTFGLFVLKTTITQAFFAHGEFLKDRPYFTHDVTPPAAQILRKRSIPGSPAIVFVEAKGTKCPGSACDTKSKNLLETTALGYIKEIERKIWNSPIFQQKYCPLIWSSSNRQAPKCRPPWSLLSFLLWGNGVTSGAKSQVLVSEGFGNFNASCICTFSPSKCPNCATGPCIAKNPSTCANYAACSYESPMGPSACKSPAWEWLSSNAGAADPAGLASYSDVLSDICTKTGSDKFHYENLRRRLLPNFACDSNYLRDHGTPFLMTKIPFGFPFDKNRLSDDFDWHDQIKDLEKDYGSDFFTLTTDAVKDVLGDVYGNDDIMVVIDSDISNEHAENAIANRDRSLSGASFLLVFLYMWFNVESCFIAAFGMLQVLFCICPAVFLWTFFDKTGIQTLQFMAIFLILGIGADDVFVLNDAFKQAKHELAGEDDSTVHVFAVAYRRSFFSMLATTMTTAWAFFFGIINPIPAIRDFCIFAALVVVCDFLFCITMFASSVAFFERYMANHTCCCCGRKAEPGACCQPGCCFGGLRICYRKLTRTPADATTDQRAIERFFSGRLFNFLCRYKILLVVFWLVLLGLAAFNVTRIKTTSKDPEGLPSTHPLQRYEIIRKEYFTQIQAETVKVVWGFDEDNPVAEWSKTEAQVPTKISFSGLNAAISKSGQQQILNMCRAPTLGAGSVRCNREPCLIRGSATQCLTHTENGISVPKDALCQAGRYCIMEQVQEYAAKSGQDFPSHDFATLVGSSGFKQYLKDYFDLLTRTGQHWHAKQYEDETGVVMQGSTVQYMWVTFNATFEGKFLPPKEGSKIFDDWDQFLKGHISGTKYHMITLMFLFKILQDMLLREALINIGVSLAVAYVVLVLMTWNFYISFLGLVNISFIVTLFLGTWPIMGWELDIYNIIFLIATVGLSIDYTVHLLHSFNESGASSREERVKDALSNMGITVLSGAITTLLAAFPLFGCVSLPLQRFGTFVFLCITFSIITAIFLLTPMVLLIGPKGHFGDVGCFFWLRDRYRVVRKG